MGDPPAPQPVQGTARPLSAPYRHQPRADVVHGEPHTAASLVALPVSGGPGQGTPTRTERRIIKVRVLRRWGPARIAGPLRLVPSTLHRVLTR